MHRIRFSGFTLAELLIALAILGVIAVFAIPKVLQSQQDGKANAIAKETAASVSGAFQAYQLNNAVTVNTGAWDLTPYLNYVAFRTTGEIDEEYGKVGSKSCSGVNDGCVVLHNGAVLWLNSGNNFSGGNATDYLYLILDPNSTVDSAGSATGPGKSVAFALYMNGKLRTRAHCEAGELTWFGGTSNDWCPGDPAEIPPWFSW